MKEKTIGYKIMHFPLTKIIIGVIIVAGMYGLSQYLIGELVSMLPVLNGQSKLIIGIGSSLIAIVAYWLLYRYYEKRAITELSLKRIGTNLLIGFLIGAALQSLTILVMYLMGGYEITATHPFIYLIPALTMAFTSSIFEEILFRGILFRIIEEKLGSYIALLISALIFGALHYSNPNSSFINALGLAIQAGLLLGAAYMYTRNLWMPIALHFAWNFMQSGIYGAAVSGHKIEQSLFESNITGAEWYTGGAFGPEGSIQATVFCLIATAILLYLCHRYNKLIAPYWKRKELTK